MLLEAEGNSKILSGPARINFNFFARGVTLLDVIGKLVLILMTSLDKEAVGVFVAFLVGSKHWPQ